ncbi:hypothetical protein LCGC14_1229490 [marine sediment metagenome]|uniref:Uncharacterized protein n=1 Tax=marine sediment metagenome TaxID=412755 RepID=A0A0F9LD26_9ZZZZ
MGVIKIQDVGYIKPTNEGTQASSANRANSGTAISLKVAEFVPSLKRNISSEPELATNTPSEVNQGSLENMQFQLTCKLKTSDATDMGNVQHLLDMVATNGYKLMWYDYTSASVENNNGQLIYRIALNSKFGHQITNGEKSAFTITDNFYHLHVFFFDILPRQVPDSNIITYTLMGIVLKVETSII